MTDDCWCLCKCFCVLRVRVSVSVFVCGGHAHIGGVDVHVEGLRASGREREQASEGASEEESFFDVLVEGERQQRHFWAEEKEAGGSGGRQTGGLHRRGLAAPEDCSLCPHHHHHHGSFVLPSFVCVLGGLLSAPVSHGNVDRSIAQVVRVGVLVLIGRQQRFC